MLRVAHQCYAPEYEPDDNGNMTPSVVSEDPTSLNTKETEDYGGEGAQDAFWVVRFGRQVKFLERAGHGRGKGREM